MSKPDITTVKEAIAQIVDGINKFVEAQGTVDEFDFEHDEIYITQRGGSHDDKRVQYTLEVRGEGNRILSRKSMKQQANN